MTPPLVSLRPVIENDLDAIFLYRSDVEANRVAVANPRDPRSFRDHWARVLADPAVVPRVILVDGAVVGDISCFPSEGRNFVGYWIAREHWGRGIATRALALLLAEVTTRPLHARAARSNVASIRVLVRSGFRVTGHEVSEATEQFPACEEALLVLEA